MPNDDDKIRMLPPSKQEAFRNAFTEQSLGRAARNGPVTETYALQAEAAEKLREAYHDRVMQIPGVQFFPPDFYDVPAEHMDKLAAIMNELLTGFSTIGKGWKPDEMSLAAFLAEEL